MIRYVSTVEDKVTTATTETNKIPSIKDKHVIESLDPISLAFYPQLAVLSFLGIPFVRDTNEERCRPGWWSVFILFILCVYCFHHLALLVNNFDNASSLVWFAASNFLDSLSCTITAITFTYHSERVHKFIDTLDWWDVFGLPTRSRQKLRIWIMVTTILGGFYVIGNSTILFVMHGEDLQVYLQTHLYGVSDKHFTKQLQYVIAFVDALLFCILIRGINIFTGLFYIFVCRVIASNFSTLNDILKAAALKNNITPNAVRRFRKLHTELADLVITIDDIVNFILFCWYSTILFDLCIDIYYFFIFESKTHDDQAQRTTAGILDLYRFTYSLVFFLSTSFSAANVTEEAHASLPLVHKLTDEQAITDWELQEQTLLLSAQLTAPEVGFTGWHFFYIDRSFILSVTGVVISFCVVIVQMNTSPTSSTGPTH